MTARAFIWIALIGTASHLSSGQARKPPFLTLEQPAVDIVFDPSAELIYASVPANASARPNELIAIDPYSGTVEWSVLIGNNPGRLALSEGGQYLYIALNSTNAVRRLDLGSRSVDLEFSLGETPDGPVYANDLRILPGAPESVAVARRPQVVRLDPFADAESDITIYDNGVARPNAGGPGTLIAFNGDGSVLYALRSIVFSRFAVDASGLTHLGSTTNFVGGDYIEFSGGLLYAAGDASGLAVDPEEQVPVGSFRTVEPAEIDFRWNPWQLPRRDLPLHRPERDLRLPETSFVLDSENSRYFLVSRGSPAHVRVFDLNTFCWIGSIPVPQTPARLVRWGKNGLAFNSTGLSSGRIYLFETPLIRTEASADLAVTQIESADPVGVGTNLTYTVTVRNKGPADATGVILTNTLPSSVTFVSATLSQGEYAMDFSRILCDLGVIPSGGTATLTVVVRPTMAGLRSNVAAVSAATPDPDPSNNTSTLVTRVERDYGPNLVSAIALVNNGLVYDAVRERIYASVPGSAGSSGNSIAIVHPLSRKVEEFVFVGSAPGLLAISDDAQFLYVALDGAQAIRRIDLATMTPGPKFQAPGRIASMSVAPGRPETVAVASEEISIFDDGVPRPAALSGLGPALVRFGETPAVLYGVTSSNTFHRFELDASGIVASSEVMPIGFWPVVNDFAHAGGLIYLSSGRVLDPVGQTFVGNLNAAGSIALDEPAGRLFVLSSAWPMIFSVFDQRALVPLDSFVLEEPVWARPGLIRWGQDGLAFRNTNHLFLARTLLTQTAAPADLAVSLEALPNPATVANPLTYSSSIINRGSNPAEGVTGLYELPIGAQFISAEVSQGSFEVSGNRFVWQAGTLAPGESASVSIEVMPHRAGRMTCLARVASRGIDLNYDDNLASVTARVGFLTGRDTAWVLALDAAGLAFDPGTEKLYATVRSNAAAKANSIVAIEPYTGLTGEPVPVGIDPGKIARSDDNQFLYFTLEGGRVIRRFDLETQTPGPQFTLGTDASSAGYVAVAFEVMPGRADTLAVIRNVPNSTISKPHLVIYDGDVPRENTVETGIRITFSDDGSVLYALGDHLDRIDVNESGAVLAERFAWPADVITDSIRYAGGLLYTSSGQVVDPNSGQVVASFPEAPFRATQVVPEPEADRVYFLQSSMVRGFDLSGNLIGQLPGYGLGADSLVRWGEDGVALRNGQFGVFPDGTIGTVYHVLISRTSLTPLAPDSNGDGIPDEWYLQYGFDPHGPSVADLDSDGNGVTNREKYLAGTDPLDPESVLRWTSVRADETGLHLSFTTAANRRYCIERSSDLHHWTVIADALSGTGGPVEISVPPSASPVHYFYRVKLRP